MVAFRVPVTVYEWNHNTYSQHPITIKLYTISTHLLHRIHLRYML